MNLMTKLSENALFKITDLNLIIALILIISLPVYAQDTSEQMLRDGIGLYQEGDFDQAIVKLLSCVENGELSEKQMIDAYKYLAQAYISKNLPDQASEFVEKLLKINPDYETDPEIDRPEWIKLVTRIKEKLRQNQRKAEKSKIISPATSEKKSKTKKWLIIGGGAISGVVIAVILWPSEKEREKDLPSPPLLPVK